MSGTGCRERAVRRMTDVVADSAASAEAPETVATYLRLRGLKPSAKNWKRKGGSPSTTTTRRSPRP